MTELSKKQNNASKNIAPDMLVILRVDNNAINLQMRHQSLEGQGYKLLNARSGEDALRITREANPDLILLDVMMPGSVKFVSSTKYYWKK
jgi:CheY-like chemotaxis protein